MADNINTSDSGNSFLGFIVGGLLVVVVIFGFLYYNGNFPGQRGTGSSTSISIEAPKVTPPAPSK